MFNFHHERFQRSLCRQLFRIIGPSFWLDLCLSAKPALYTFGFPVNVGGDCDCRIRSSESVLSVNAWRRFGDYHPNNPSSNPVLSMTWLLPRRPSLHLLCSSSPDYQYPLGKNVSAVSPNRAGSPAAPTKNFLSPRFGFRHRRSANSVDRRLQVKDLNSTSHSTNDGW